MEPPLQGVILGQDQQRSQPTLSCTRPFGAEAEAPSSGSPPLNLRRGLRLEEESDAIETDLEDR